jgi:putative ABC transport system permease protein
VTQASRFAGREIRRARLRFALLAGAVGLLVFLILFQQTLLSTLVSFFSGALETQSAQVVVYSDEARKSPEGSVLSLDTVEEVAAVDGVARAEPFGVDTVTARAGGEELDVALFGYLLGGPGAPTKLVEGRLPRDGNEGVASDIDEDRGFAVGDTVTVVGPSGRLPIRIVGRASDLRFSVEPAVFVSYETFTEAGKVKNPDAQDIPPSMVAVEPVPGADPAAVAERINAEVDGVEALDRATAVDSLPGVAAVTTSFTIILTLAFVVVTLLVGIFFVILTVQKSPSLTLLRAIGASGGFLVRALLVQVVAIVVTGVAVGAALLWLASLASSAQFPISFDLGVVLTRGAAVLVLAVLASLAATRRVLRIDPVEATAPLGVYT